MTSLTILSSEVRQLDNLYSLNDLHTAAGNDDKHRPTFFLRNDQTKELIEELRCADSHIIPFKTIRGKGKEQGTYVCKELVYSYAMWISAKFHLLVIRAFDALQGQPSSNPLPLPKTKALPGGLSVDQQEVIKLLVKERIEQIPQDKRAKAAITCWSALKSKFGNTYKAIASEHFTEAVSLVARLPLEGEYIPAGKEEQKAEELFTSNDTANLSRVIWLLSHRFHFEGTWSQGAWRELRKATNTPSPQRFRVADLPVIASELRRLWFVSQAAWKFLREAESEFVKRAVRKGEDIDALIAEQRALLDNALKEDLTKFNGVMGVWEESEIQNLTSREQPHRLFAGGAS